MIYERGLSWLASKQNDEGSWQGGNDGPGVNGICVMAFLASGDDPNFGKYARNVRRGVRAILKSQQESGYFPSSMYHHGFAMLALSEAYGAVDEALLWEGEKPVRTISQALDLAIRLSGTSQKNNRWSGWRYSPEARDADTSVTGAMLMGLLAARNAGMEVSDEVIEAALEYMRRSTSKESNNPLSPCARTRSTATCVAPEKPPVTKCSTRGSSGGTVLIGPECQKPACEEARHRVAAPQTAARPTAA